MHAPFGGLCLARPHSLSFSPPPDYALLERLFERASRAHAPLEHPRDILATPAYALLARLFERQISVNVSKQKCDRLEKQRSPKLLTLTFTLLRHPMPPFPLWLVLDFRNAV